MQTSFSELEYAAKKKLTRRDRFLFDIDNATPWGSLHQLIEPFYPKAIGAGRPPIGLARMLRMYVAQQCFSLSDEGIEDAIYDSQAIRGFVGIDLNREAAPDATTLLKFRHLLEAKQLTRQIFEAINTHLAEQGLIMREGTIVDATLIAAPPSTKNKDGKRDPDMHQSKKGNNWHFGMKAHIGVDAASGLVHTVIGTAGNVADVTQAHALLHGQESAAPGKNALALACTETARLLGLPEGYRVGVVPGSDTGAVEMAMWSMLGQRGVDVLAWESFGSGWVTDIVKQLKLPNVNTLKADYGDITDLSKVNFDNDVVFTWNGTTSGVKVPNGDWIPADRAGLTICDATSAVFAMELPWDKLDVITFSWQKVLGGEGAHGILILGPRAVARLESYTPVWPLPKVFRMTSGGKLIDGIFKGATINTPSMLCVADYLDALKWVESIGGVPTTIARSEANLKVVADFVAANDWIQFLAKDPATRSNTSVCMTLTLPEDKVKQMVKLLETQGVAYDIGAYVDAPAGLRIWCGATVETADLEALMPWLSWAYTQVAQ